MKQTIHDWLYVIGLLIIAILVLGAPFQILWNWLIPHIFGLPEITFWESCGLQLLFALVKSTAKNVNQT
jgi:hypothetical protein